MPTDLEHSFAEHRPAILRHCYRMLGSFAEAEELTQDTFERAWKARESFQGSAPIGHWLMRIATNGCLNALGQRKRRALPNLEADPTTSHEFGPGELERWLTPAPDALLFPQGENPASPEQLAETRESVALAFLELLQRLPAKQRAALLLKDVVGWSAEEIATTLELSVSAVNSALHRARDATQRETAASEAPSAATVAAFVRAWETRDVDGLVALLKHDVQLAMPPYPVWFSGRDAVMGFLHSARFAPFWSSLSEVAPTQGNGQSAFVFRLRDATGGSQRTHSVMLVRFAAEQVKEMVTFVGETYFEPFCRRSAS
ncbi:MAG: RNA polymerase subunit sigma-70 [Myxococcales bacterium]|nr:RNA polymerase subunit sigma-70 [Myxococcales bacterium]